MTEDETVGWHHRLNAHKLEQTLGDGEGQGSLVCCSSWGREESDTTQQLNSSNKQWDLRPLVIQFSLNHAELLGNLTGKKKVSGKGRTQLSPVCLKLFPCQKVTLKTGQMTQTQFYWSP